MIYGAVDVPRRERDRLRESEREWEGEREGGREMSSWSPFDI